MRPGGPEGGGHAWLELFPRLPVHPVFEDLEGVGAAVHGDGLGSTGKLRERCCSSALAAEVLDAERPFAEQPHPQDGMVRL